MANVTRATKRIIDPISGIVREVEIEVDRKADEMTSRFQVAADVQRSLGFNLDSRDASTIGRGKHTGNMAKSMAARTYKGNASNKAFRNKRHEAEARRTLANA